MGDPLGNPTSSRELLGELTTLLEPSAATSEQNYINKIREFTINSEISAVHNCGCLTFDEVSTTGILMPLKFNDYYKRFSEI